MTTEELLRHARAIDSGWIIKGLLRPGLGLLLAPPKVGKTRLAIDLSISVATGRPFLAHPISRPGPVIHYGFEPSANDLVNALSAFNAPHDADVDWRLELPSDGTFESFKLDLTQLVRARSDTALVVVDMWDAIAYPHQAEAFRNDTSYKRMRAVLRPYHQLAHELGLAIVLLHHPSSQSPTAPNGGPAISGTVDFIWTLQREPNAGSASLAVTGRNLQETTHDLHWDHTLGRFTERRNAETFTIKLAPSSARERIEQIVYDTIGRHWMTRPSLIDTVNARLHAAGLQPGAKYVEKVVDSHAHTQVKKRVFDQRRSRPVAYRRSMR